MKRPGFDLRVYLVTDPAMTARRGLVETVRAAVAGGATIVQLRDKDSTDGALIDQARALRAALAGTGVRLIVNDRFNLALAAGADGLHVGQDDMAASKARVVMGPRAIIGLSVTTEAEIAGLDPGVVDYAGLGPIFGTATKPDAGEALGAKTFARLRATIPVPVVAIGGISSTNAASAFAAGADGVAVVSAICAAADPEAAARELRAVAEHARASR
jgi:thiamine-phosphate pyrophosphorylase